jgi:hypothetical protein
MKKVKLTSEQQKHILEAHNRLIDGIKLGVNKSQRTGYLDTPLFKQDNQTNLF